MAESPFSELSITAKRALFFGLITSFIVYTFAVHTSATQYTKGEASYTPSAKNGKLVFQKYNCISCHQFYGLGGFMGPDLTNVMSAKGKGRPYAEVFIRNGTAKMPKFDMTEEEETQLLDYLQYVSNAGNYPITDFELTWYGTVNNNPQHEQ